MNPDQYSDDPSIPDDAILWRFIRPEHVVFDKKLESVRPKSLCFTDSSDGSPMSALIAERVADSGRNARDLLVDRWAGCYIVSFAVGFIRNELGLGVTAHPPVPDEPAHAWVFGKKTRKVRSDLARAEGTRWVVGPPEAPD
jgi:hypothetical protein